MRGRDTVGQLAEPFEGGRHERRIAKIELVITEDKPAEEEIREVQVELPEPELPEPEVALTENEKFGDEEEQDEPVGEEEDQRDRTSELVDMLNPRNNEPINASAGRVHKDGEAMEHYSNWSLTACVTASLRKSSPSG